MSILRFLAIVAGGTALGILLFGVLGSRLRTPETVHGTDEAQPLSVAIAAFNPSEIVTVLPRDGIEAIFDPVLVPASRVPRSELAPRDRVIGIEVEGQARAYPVKVLSAHEIVNDEVAGKPYAVTW